MYSSLQQGQGAAGCRRRRLPPLTGVHIVQGRGDRKVLY